MKKETTQKHLLTGSSVLALAAVSVAVMPSQAFAAWGSITAPTTAAQTVGADGEELNISGAGDVAVAVGNAAINTNKINTKIVVNTTSTATGISSTGNFSAITVSGTGTLINLTNTKGTITGAGTGAATATVFLDGGDATTAIQNDSTISNTGAGGVAINIGGTKINKVTLNNTGSIISTGSAASDAIDVADKATATFALTNTGTITAGASGNAIKIAAGGNTVATITNTSGTITGGVVLGANAGSKLNVNGGTIAGNVTLGDAGQIMTLGGGQVNGTITGPGLVNATADYTTNGAIASVTKLTITDGKTFDTATHNDALGATNIAVGTSTAGATLNVGTGVVTGAVDSGSAGTSTINFKASNVLGVGTNIGAGTGFAAINIADGATVNAATNNVTLKATNIKLGTSTGAGGTLTLGTGAVTGAIDGGKAGTGTINFNGNQTNAATIGGTTGIAAINVLDGKTVVLNADAKATTTTIGTGTSGVLTLNAGKTLTGAVNISDGATFNQQTTGIVTGAVNGVTANKGTYNVNTAGAFATNGAIGATTGLAAFTTGDGVAATLAHNIKATTVTVGGGASGSATQTAGLITGNLLIGQSATFDINGGSGVTGTIDGAANNTGNVLSVKSAFTSPSTIGAVNGLSAVNVTNGGSLTLGGNMKATLTTVGASSTLNLGSSAHTVTGKLTGTGTGLINAAGAQHTLTSDLTTASTNTLGFAINSGTNDDAGRITSGGTVSIAAGTTVALDTSKATGYITNGAHYLLVSGTGANANAVTVTGGSTNFLTFASDLTTGNQLNVKAVRSATYASVATSQSGKSIGAALDALGANGNAQISQIQGRLDGTTTQAQANAVLAEVTPQIQATSVMSSNAVQKSLDVVSERGSDLRAGIDNSYSGMTAGNGVADKGLWVQAFGTTATQDLRSGVQGYDADTYGVAVGADAVVADHTRAGLSVSYGNTTVDGKGTARQNTDIDTYQVNLYGFHDMGNWYTDGLLGFAWQNYNSDRFITAPASTASADYDGQTYTARVNGGYRMAAGNGIQIIPNAGLTYLDNEINGYTETGAGGLNLTVRDYNSQALFGRIGFDVAKDFTSGSMVVRPVLRAAYLYDFIGDQASTNALFTGGGGTFRVSDASPERSSFNVGASLNLMTTKNVTLSADYDYLVKSDYDSHSGMLRARFGF